MFQRIPFQESKITPINVFGHLSSLSNERNEILIHCYSLASVKGLKEGNWRFGATSLRLKNSMINTSSAIAHCRKSSSKGNFDGTFWLARLLQAHRNYEESFILYQRLNEIHHPSGSLFLGIYYGDGRFVRRNEEQAKFYWRQALKENDYYCAYYASEYLNQSLNEEKAFTESSKELSDCFTF
jgi:TPR repeat protein